MWSFILLLAVLLGCSSSSLPSSLTSAFPLSPSSTVMSLSPASNVSFIRVDVDWNASMDRVCPGNHDSRGRPPRPPYTETALCLCRVSASVVETRGQLKAELYNGTGVVLPASSLVLFGGQTFLWARSGDAVDNAVFSACASVDGGRTWMRLASGGEIAARELTTGCYDRTTGTAYLFPNDISDRADTPTPTPTAYYSSDFSHWYPVLYPPMWVRRGGFCFVNSQSLPIALTGLYLNLSADGGEREVSDWWVWNDILVLTDDFVHWVDLPSAQYGLYAPRHSVLTTTQFNRTVPVRGGGFTRVDVLYLMGGQLVTVAGWSGSATRVNQEQFDLWFSVDNGQRFYQLLLSLPWIDQSSPTSMYGATLSSSPSGTLVVLGGGLYIPSTAMQLIASLDGGMTWGLCSYTLPFTARFAASLSWITESSQGRYSERLVVLGGQHTTGYGNLTAEVWVSDAVNFANITQVTEACGVARPPNDVIGLSADFLARHLHSAVNVEVEYRYTAAATGSASGEIWPKDSPSLRARID